LTPSAAPPNSDNIKDTSPNSKSTTDSTDAPKRDFGRSESNDTDGFGDDLNTGEKVDDFDWGSV
jgi:hypothetical protein